MYICEFAMLLVFSQLIPRKFWLFSDIHSGAPATAHCLLLGESHLCWTVSLRRPKQKILHKISFSLAYIGHRPLSYGGWNGVRCLHLTVMHVPGISSLSDTLANNQFIYDLDAMPLWDNWLNIHVHQNTTLIKW